MNELYNEHKPIRNKIQKYNPLSVISLCMSYLKKIDNQFNTSQALERPPNWILLLIRWAYQYGKFTIKKDISEKKFCKLINDVIQLKDCHPDLNETNNDIFVERYIKKITFEQIIPFQTIKISKMKFIYARHILLFSDIQLQKTFFNKTGLDLKKFIMIYFGYFMISSGATDSQLSIMNLKYCFKIGFNLDYSETDFLNFFNFIGLSFVDAQTYIQEDRQENYSIAFELGEHSPLEKKPVLIHNGLYIPYSNLLLRSAFKNNIYDFFKQNEPDFLSGKGIFGTQFENHVAKGIEYLGCDFMREDALKKIIGQKNMCADFLITNNNSMIIIDAKGTELHHISRVNQDPKELQKHLENQIEKALVQIFSTAYHLNNNDDYKNFTTRYALIVTYKEYQFTSLNDKHHFYTKQSLIDKLNTKGLSDSLQLIPFENIFVISIDDFDYLIGGLKANNQTMAHILQEIIHLEKNSKCMLFEQYLNKIFTKDHCPEYLFDIYKQSPFGIKNTN